MFSFMLVSFWYHVGTVLVQFWHNFGIFWLNFGDFLVSGMVSLLWYLYAPLLAPILDNFGLQFGSILGKCCITCSLNFVVVFVNSVFH
jgi:hypothetical protein